MRDDTTTPGVLFKELYDKPLLASFDQPDSSSDGDAILLKACDRKVGLIDAIASFLRDTRGRSVYPTAGRVGCTYEDHQSFIVARLGEDQPTIY